MDVLVCIRAGGPFDEGNKAVVHFDAGDGVWVDTGARVAVEPAWAGRAVLIESVAGACPGEH